MNDVNETVLFVDDDVKLLKGISRQFDEVLDFETANGPEEALELFASGNKFAVVVSDMRMPGMNGVELLTAVRERSPNTVRMMLTGFADLESTVQAVNEGNIFRFLSKPCSHDVLEKAVQDGLTQYRLITAEKELLNGTLHGSIKVLSEVLSLVNPLAFGRTSKVQRIALAIGKEMELDSLWDLKIASLLFPLGCITVSESALECALQGKPVPESEKVAFQMHAQVAKNMLKNIPRLENVSQIIGLQDKGFDGSGDPSDMEVSADEIPLGARILKAASDFEIACKKSEGATDAILDLNARQELYDPKVLEALAVALRNGLCQSSSRSVAIDEIDVGMVLASDLRGSSGQFLIASGQTVTESIKNRLQTFRDNGTIGDALDVEVLGDVEQLEPAIA